MSQVRVPMSLLLDQQLTAADKLVWMTMRLDKHIRKLTSPTRLARRTGLSRVTIYSSFERLTSAKWVMAEKPIMKPKTQPICYVNMPAKLLTAKEIKSRDKVMFGVLQAKQFFSGKKGKIKYLELSKYARTCVKTVRRAVKVLIQANWINARQVNQLKPIYYELDNPQLAYCRQRCAKIQRQLDVEDNYGETICREIVLLLVNPKEYTVNPRPSWLTNPATGMIMEIDLFIEENKLAVEYQGEQHFTNPERTVLAELLAAAPTLTEGAARNLLARFLFTGDSVFQTIGSLSGGEQTRLTLLCLLQKEPHCLILDEPTNHLDIPSRECLEEALATFKGTVIAVSHDRFFLNRIVSRILELRDGRLTSYPGNYNEYQKALILGTTTTAQKAKKTAVRTVMVTGKQSSRQRSRAATVRDLRQEKRLDLDKEISKVEKRMQELEQRFQEPDFYRNRAAHQELNEHQQLTEKLAILYEARQSVT